MNVSQRIRLIQFLACSFFFTCLVAAQQPQAPADAPFKLQAETNRVLVPVVVKDRQGHVVLHLKKEDFQVFDNGKVRPISSFSAETRGDGQDNVEVEKPAPDTIPHPRRPSARFIVFLFDDMHLTFEDLAHAERAATKVLKEALVNSDLAAVVSVSGRTNSGITQDRTKLQSAIATLKPVEALRSNLAECPNIEYYQADLIQNRHDAVALDAAIQQVLQCAPKTPADLAERMAEMTAMRTLNRGLLDIQTSFATIAEITRRMASLPGQRTLILVSPGFLTMTPEARSLESHLIDLAAQSNVTISALDARGLYTTALDSSERSPGSGQLLQLKSDYRQSSGTLAEDVMAELADGTGGTYFHNSNDLGLGLKSLTEIPECIYTLELPLDGIKQDGSYHRLKVKVDRDGIQLSARHGYYMPKPLKKK